MKRSKYAAALLMLGVLCWVPVAMATSFETGWLKDEVGSVDLKTKSFVKIASNMFGASVNGGPMEWEVRWIAVVVPMSGIDPKKVVVLDVDGNPIPNKGPETKAFEWDIDPQGTKGTLLHLHLKYREGFSFRLKYDDKSTQ